MDTHAHIGIGHGPTYSNHCPTSCWNNNPLIIECLLAMQTTTTHVASYKHW